MKIKNKKTLAILLSTVMLTAIAAKPSFAVFTGTSLDLEPADDYVPKVYVKNITAGQYIVNDFLSFKGDFLFTTDDVVDYGLFQDTPSHFFIREISGTGTVYGKKSLMQISVLLGDQTPFGSDAFVRSTLGARTFAPSLLSPQITPFSTTTQSLPGMGISFTDDFGQNAFGIYCFYNKNPANAVPQINADIRYAFGAGESLFDTDIGVTLPDASSASGTRFQIQQAILRADISSLFSISGRLQLFLQAGISDITLPDTAPVALENIFFFAEPRIILPSCDLNISFFCLTDDSLQNLQGITKPLGCSLNLESADFLFLNHTATGGITATACSGRTPSTGNLDVIITPYLDYSLFSGSFNTSVTFHPLSYNSLSDFFKVSLSYKAQL